MKIIIEFHSFPFPLVFCSKEFKFHLYLSQDRTSVCMYMPVIVPFYVIKTLQNKSYLTNLIVQVYRMAIKSVKHLLTNKKRKIDNVKHKSKILFKGGEFSSRSHKDKIIWENNNFFNLCCEIERFNSIILKCVKMNGHS